MKETYGEHCVVWVDENNAGTITAWYQDVPEGQHGERIGVIGAFKADNKQCALELIERATAYLKQKGVDTVIGPMNQNTWHSYRFQKTTSLEQPYFMEPVQPKEYTEWFEEAGFEVDQNYYSFSTSLGSFGRTKESIIEAFFLKGIEIKDGTNLTDEELLRNNYDLSRICFAENVYYTPVSYEVYQAIYQPSLPLLKKEYVYYAYSRNKPVAFLFGVPDYNQVKRGKKLETILFKTFAVLPEYRNLGIAGGLMECVAHVARDNGFTKGIMALVHEKNYTMHMLPDQKMCSHYVLYRRECHG